MNDLISLNKVSKSFFTSKKITVLNKINYKFNKGKIYSLVGPSGSGKSTLLNILSLIDKPSIGTVKINNKNISFLDSGTNDKIRAEKLTFNDNMIISNKIGSKEKINFTEFKNISKIFIYNFLI